MFTNTTNKPNINNMMIGFVILHYNNIETTTNCVNSIFSNIDTDNFYICIVDNASPDKSGKLLETMYSDNLKVDVIINSENLGFARGHNTGIRYLRTKHLCDFLVLLNSDTELVSNNWGQVIKEKYIEYEFHVMGPDIISLDRQNHANPAEIQIYCKEDLIKMIRYKRKKLLRNILYIDPLMVTIKSHIKKIIKYATPKGSIRKHIPYDVIGVQLQGSCFILSPKYFQYHEGLYDGTFLYFEEAILKYFIDRDGLISLYTPDIILLHLEGRSTNFSHQSIRKKNIFYLSNSLFSCKKLYNLIESDSIKV